MSMDVTGFDDVFNSLQALGDIGKKIGRDSVKRNITNMLEDIKQGAPKADKDSSNGAEFLKVDSVKVYPSGSVWGKAGITSENWEQTKHLLFQHYGYEHYKEGKLVQAHVGWMDSVFDKCKDKHGKALLEDIIKEIDKVWNG